LENAWQDKNNRTSEEQRRDPQQEAVEPGKATLFFQLCVCMWQEVVKQSHYRPGQTQSVAEG
jgi:hypothetical protein